MGARLGAPNHFPIRRLHNSKDGSLTGHKHLLHTRSLMFKTYKAPEYFSMFDWAMPIEYRDALEKCQFEYGDLLYDKEAAYEEETWGEALKQLSYVISIQSPPRSQITQASGISEGLFEINWNKPVELRLHNLKTDERKSIHTSQGNLYMALWKGLDHLEGDKPPAPKSALKGLSECETGGRLLREARLHTSGPSFIMPFDETYPLLREKRQKILKRLKKAGIPFKLFIARLEKVRPGRFLPSANMLAICAECDSDTKMLACLRKALYVENKNVEKRTFRVFRHGFYVASDLKENSFVDDGVEVVIGPE